MVKVKLNPDLVVLSKLDNLSVKELGKYKLICPKRVWIPLRVGVYTDMVVEVKQEDSLIIMEEKKGWTTIWLNAEPSKWEVEVSEDFSIVSYDDGLFIITPKNGYMIVSHDGKSLLINLKNGTTDTRLTHKELTALIKILKIK